MDSNINNINTSISITVQEENLDVVGPSFDQIKRNQRKWKNKKRQEQADLLNKKNTNAVI